MIMSIFAFLKFSIISTTFNSNERISTCQDTVYNDLPNEQNVLNNFLVNERYNEQAVFKDEVLTFNYVEDMNSFSNFCSIEQETKQPIKEKNLSLSPENSVFDFLDNVDYVDVPEELEKLNNLELNVLNPTDLEEIFRHEENLNKMSVNVTKDYNLFNRKKLKNSTEDQNQYSKKNDIFETDLKIKHGIITKKYMQKIKCNLLHFIKKTIPDYYVDFYIRRLTALEHTFASLNVFYLKNYNALTSRDCELIKILTKLHSNFGKNYVYNQETYHSFNYEFKLVISEQFVSHYCTPIVNLSKNYERYYFYIEMMKI